MKFSKKIIGVFGFAYLLCCQVLAEAQEPLVSLGTGEVLKSRILNEEVPLSIHLPEDYDESSKQYPIIYMMGSDYRVRFAMLASTLDYMADSQIPASILIGVDFPKGNGILVPNRETGDTSVPDAYMDFLEKELLPYVDKKYRSAPYRSLYGASNSGFFALYTMLNKPELFDSYLASSPMVGWTPDMFNQKVQEGPLQKATKPLSLHIVYSDDDSDRVTNYVPGFIEVLEKHKPEGLAYKVEELSNKGHVPASDFVRFLNTQYPDYNAPEELDTIEKVTGHFDMLSQRYGYTLSPPHPIVFDIGVAMTLRKNYEPAEKVFDYLLKLYPKHKKSYVGMGFLRREQGDKATALNMFEKALEIDPEYGLAQRLLARLQE